MYMYLLLSIFKFECYLIWDINNDLKNAIISDDSVSSL